jgi:hypothetical protein
MRPKLKSLLFFSGGTGATARPVFKLAPVPVKADRRSRSPGEKTNWFDYITVRGLGPIHTRYFCTQYWQQISIDQQR